MQLNEHGSPSQGLKAEKYANPGSQASHQWYQPSHTWQCCHEEERKPEANVVRLPTNREPVPSSSALPYLNPAWAAAGRVWVQSMALQQPSQGQKPASVVVGFSASRF